MSSIKELEKELKESNYKDLRVIQEFFEEYHYA